MTLSTEQQALRSTGIGASEIAAVCGVHPHMHPIDVYCRKTGDAPDDFDGNEMTEWGTLRPRSIWWRYGATGTCTSITQGQCGRSPPGRIDGVIVGGPAARALLMGLRATVE